MKKNVKIVAAMMLLVVCVAGLLVGCGAKPVEEADIDRISTYYFDQKLGDNTWTNMTRLDDVVLTNKSGYCVSAETLDGSSSYCIVIMKDGSGVYSYGIQTGKANRLGGTDVGTVAPSTSTPTEGPTAPEK